MTGSKCLLDTSVVIHAFKNNNTVVERLDAILDIYIPIEVVGELYFGAYRSSNPIKHISQLESFLPNCNILLPDKMTADIYGKTKAKLMSKGKPIPENDIWIGALALQHNLPVFITDAHFTEIDNISLIK
jgi:tRNA(fMet)-specific endonuclease VapC